MKYLDLMILLFFSIVLSTSCEKEETCNRITPYFKLTDSDRALIPNINSSVKFENQYGDSLELNFTREESKMKNYVTKGFSLDYLGFGGDESETPILSYDLVFYMGQGYVNGNSNDRIKAGLIYTRWPYNIDAAKEYDSCQENPISSVFICSAHLTDFNFKYSNLGREQILPIWSLINWGYIYIDDYYEILINETAYRYMTIGSHTLSKVITLYDHPYNNNSEANLVGKTNEGLRTVIRVYYDKDYGIIGFDTDSFDKNEEWRIIFD